MGPSWLALLLVMAVCLLAMAGPIWLLVHAEEVGERAARVARRLDPQTPPPRPCGRPIELIAADLRRLGYRTHHPPPGVRFVKMEGLRRAYDKVLAEACEALGHPHLLGVLPPGDELDAERSRVESLLWLDGLRVDTGEAA